LNISLLDISINKQLLQQLKSKKFSDSVVLAFLECTCYSQNLAKRTCISNMCRPIFKLWQLNHIWSASD